MKSKPDRRDRPTDGPVERTPASPYGPHPHGVDEAAGGADSSPYENESTGARKEKAEADRRKDRYDGPAGDTDVSP